MAPSRSAVDRAGERIRQTVRDRQPPDESDLEMVEEFRSHTCLGSSRFTICSRVSKTGSEIAILPTRRLAA